MRTLLSSVSPVLRLTRVTSGFAAIGNVWFVVLWSRANGEETGGVSVRHEPLWLLLLGGAAAAVGLYGSDVRRGVERSGGSAARQGAEARATDGGGRDQPRARDRDRRGLACGGVAGLDRWHVGGDPGRSGWTIVVLV
ncbi:MAG: hypothetical protein KF705_03885 [Phycisphaeraceae bacterium]|nr:hypothetical protein [Phycisphaeraceae bacterium]